MKPVKVTLFVLAFSLAIVSCKKENHAQPSVSLRGDEGYTASDITVDTATLITFGIVANKTETEMKLFNVSAVYDGGGKRYDVETDALLNDQASHYERSFTVKAQNFSGTEKWIFSITDAAGHTAQKAVTLTVKVP